MKALVVVTSGALLCGCVSITNMEEQCAGYRNVFLAGAGLEKSKELQRTLSPEEWEAARDGRVYVGMSEAGARCAWGEPDAVSRSSYGATQYVYERDGVPWGYVYIEDAVVVDWSTQQL